MQTGAPYRAIDDRAWLYYLDEFQPLIAKLCKLRRSWWRKAVTLHEEMLWYCLVSRPYARQQLIAAIQTAGRYCCPLDISFQWTQSFKVPGVEWNDIRRSLLEVGEAFWVYPAIKSLTVDLAFSADFAMMDDIVADILARLCQVRSLTFSCSSRDDANAPMPVLQSLTLLSRLEEFTFLAHQDDKMVGIVAQSLMNSATIKKFTVTGSSSRRHRLILQDANAIADLLQVGTIIELILVKIKLVDDSVSRSLCDAIATSPSLSSLRFSSLSFSEDKTLFYTELGLMLPHMVSLRELSIDMGNFMSNGQQTQKHIKGHRLRHLLIGAARSSSLCCLYLPSCIWTRALGELLAECVLSCETLHTLAIKGSIESCDLPLAALGPALGRGSLEEFSCELEGNIADALASIASGIAASRTITCLSMTTTKISFAMMRQIFHVLSVNETLKTLQLFDPSHGHHYEGWSDELRVSMLESISLNVSLTSIVLPFSRAMRRERSVQCLAHCIAELNKAGRCYIKSPNNPSFQETAIRILEAVNWSLDCIYIHLREIPVIFVRPCNRSSEGSDFIDGR